MCACRRRFRPGERAEAGFSLVELVLGIGLAGLLLLSLGMALIRAQSLQRRVEARMEAQRAGYVALERLSEQIALAGLNLDPTAGEEGFPPLLPGAGTDWASAVAIQYRPAGGSPAAFSYYLHDGKLMEAVDGQDPKPLTAAECQVTALSFAYFTENNLPLDPASLADSHWRAQIRRVQVRLTLAPSGSPTADDYELETAVVVPNWRG